MVALEKDFPPYDHDYSHLRAIITNPRSQQYKVLMAANYSVSDWRKIVNFYSNHEYFLIEVESLL